VSNPFLLKRLWWLPWAVFFGVAVVGTRRCAEWAAADEPKITEGFDAETWKPCPGRKKIRQHGHTYTWYCGPEHPDFEAAKAQEKVKEPAKQKVSGHK